MTSYHESRRCLEEYIEAESESLHRMLRSYVMRAGLASGAAVYPAADDLLHEVVIEAFKTAERFKPDIQPRAWLLGIAANLIKRQQAERARRERREPLLRDLYPRTEETLSDEELFDQLSIGIDATLAEMEENEQITSLLLGLSKSDADLLRLAVLHDMNGEALAKTLGVTVNAARVRLHRALQRLRRLRQNQERAAHE